MERLYKPLALRNAPVMFVGREFAELAKYAANAFLALKISFINEIADLCEEVGADVQEVAAAIGKDRRIGDKFLHPGPGYGGSCFPKDVSALIRTAREHKSPLSIIEQVQRVNDERKIAMAQRIEQAAGGSVRGKTIAVLGVTFKPNTDDMRDAPSLVIVPMLQERGATVRVYDPQGRRHGEALLPGVVWCDSALEAASGADVLVVAHRVERVPRPRSQGGARRRCAATCWSICATCSRPPWRMPPACATRPSAASRKPATPPSPRSHGARSRAGAG